MSEPKTKATILAELAAPFAPAAIMLLPKPYKKDSERGKCNVCGGFHGLPAVHLDYVGHAEVTDRLLKVDPEWNWEPLAFGADGLPAMIYEGTSPVGLWIKLTIGGVTRLGFGSVGKGVFDAEKQLISDAIRNAAMRFGVALQLWAKSDLAENVIEKGDAAVGEGMVVAADGSPVNPKTGEMAPKRTTRQQSPRAEAIDAGKAVLEKKADEIQAAQHEAAAAPLVSAMDVNEFVEELKAMLRALHKTWDDVAAVLKVPASKSAFGEWLNRFQFDNPGGDPVTAMRDAILKGPEADALDKLPFED